MKKQKDNSYVRKPKNGGYTKKQKDNNHTKQQKDNDYVEKSKDNNKVSYFKLFFTKYTLWGFLIILISVILDLLNTEQIFVIDIIKGCLSTIGVALLIGAIFDFSKNSEAFTIFVSNILRNIVISKDFLNVMSEEEKKNSLELILKPTNLQIEQCSSIDQYYKKSIATFMDLYNAPFKTNLIININIKKENNRIIARGNMTHKIYKVNGKYEPIITTFERDECEICESYIILPTGDKIKLENEFVKETNDKYEIGENGEIAKKYETIIPEQYSSYPFLTVCREILEIGNDHWINFHWLTLTICDGIHFTLACDKGITIKDYLVFDNKKCYNIDVNHKKDNITIISTNWLNSYSGFTITISDT